MFLDLKQRNCYYNCLNCGKSIHRSVYIAGIMADILLTDFVRIDTENSREREYPEMLANYSAGMLRRQEVQKYDTLLAGVRDILSAADQLISETYAILSPRRLTQYTIEHGSGDNLDHGILDDDSVTMQSLTDGDDTKLDEDVDLNAEADERQGGTVGHLSEEDVKTGMEPDEAHDAKSSIPEDGGDLLMKPCDVLLPITADSDQRADETDLTISQSKY